MATLQLTDEQRQAVEAQQGCVSVESPDGKYVLMRMDVYRELLGISSDREWQESLAAIRRGWEDVQAGRTRPLRDVLDELSRKYEIPH